MKESKNKQRCKSSIFETRRGLTFERRVFVCFISLNASLSLSDAISAAPPLSHLVAQNQTEPESGNGPEPQSSVPKPPAATPDSVLQLRGLRIRAHFDAALFDARSEKVKQSQLKTFCKSWGDALLLKKGPWGFGVASEVTCAEMDSPHPKLTDEMKLFDVWNLIVRRIQIEGRDVIEASICRLKTETKSEEFNLDSDDVKCEAKRVFPWSDFKVRFVRHRAFVRLVVASLYDQLPFLSVVSKSIVRFDNLRIEGFKEPETYEVSFPSPPNDVVFAEVQFDPYERRFALRAIPENDAIYKTMTQSGHAWMIHKEGRGVRFDEFSERIENAYLALTTIFQLDKMKFEKDKAKALAEKLKNRNYFDLVIRAGGVYGLPLLVMDSGVGGDLSAHVQVNRLLGGGVKGTYDKLRFSLETVVQEKDSTGSSVNSTEVKLAEMNLWAYGSVTPQFDLKVLEPLRLFVSPRIGLLQITGNLLSSGSIPDSDVGVESRELGIGVVALAGWTFADKYELSSLTSFDLGASIKSTTLRTGIEFGWILSRLVTLGRDERPPQLKVGLNTHFSSMSREFSTTELGRSFATKVTLNGLQTGFFVEQTF